jgi:hypothetical protein
VTKDFDISDVLSITHSRLVSTRRMDGVYDILNFMTGESLFTHALPRACESCQPALLAQFPELAKESAEHVDTTNWKQWLHEMCAKHGDVFTVKPLAAGSYEVMHPLAEPIIRDKEVIQVIVPER